MSSQHVSKSLTLSSKVVVTLVALAFALAMPVDGQDKRAEVARKLQGFDAFMEKTLKDWNAPGISTIAGTLRFRDYGSYIEDLKRGGPSK